MSTKDPKDGRERDPLAEKTAALPRDIQPSRELWPGVANRIRQSDPRPAGASSASRSDRNGWWSSWFAGFRPSWGTVAVAAGLAAILSAGLTSVLVKSRPAPSYTESQSSALATLDAIAAECVRIRDDLDLDHADAYLSEETRSVIETNLQIVELAATESREALAGDPRNAGLVRKAATDYQNQLALLRKAAQLSIVDDTEPEAPSTSPRESET